MTALDITVNDGLRLSELYGQLADLNYRMDNLGLYIHDQKLHATMVIIGLGAVLGIALFVLALTVMFDWWYDSEKSGKVFFACVGVYILILAIIWAVSMDYIDTYAVYNLECDMSRVQGEIDGIMARYGGASS